jgi:hypothetical protein
MSKELPQLFSIPGVLCKTNMDDIRFESTNNLSYLAFIKVNNKMAVNGKISFYFTFFSI